MEGMVRQRRIVARQRHVVAIGGHQLLGDVAWQGGSVSSLHGDGQQRAWWRATDSSSGAGERVRGGDGPSIFILAIHDPFPNLPTTPYQCFPNHPTSTW
ncbi:hypothetical protein ACLOJK_012511 [Asimina triloba]